MGEDAKTVAAEHIAALAAGQPAGGPVSLDVFHAGCDPMPFIQELDGVPDAVLVQLRADRCCPTALPSTPPDANDGRQMHGARQV